MGTHEGHKRQAYADTAALLSDVFNGLAENAEAFTCREIEALAEIYRLHRLDISANALVAYHADGDDEGDDHYRGDAS